MSIADESYARMFGFDRPPVERCVRVTVEHRGYTYEPAVEWRDGDDFEAMTGQLEAIARDPDMPRNTDAMEQSHMVGLVIACVWPGRAYFVEVWQEGKRGFAQVFQPFGVPRNRP